MSEYTQCNRCTLEAIRKRAKQNGNRIYRRGRSDGWIDIFVCPKDTKINPRMRDLITSKEREKYFVTSFMEITRHCCC